MSYQRVVVVGGPGSGKTTVAMAIADRLDLPHHELDAFWWGPDWTPVGPDVLASRVGEAMATGRWVFDGNYLDEVAASLIWPAAEVIVWLDLPRHLALRRAIGRTAGRILHRQTLWSDNRESLATLSPASLVRLFRRWPDYPRRVQELWDSGVTDAELVRMRNQAQVQAWLESLAADGPLHVPHVRSRGSTGRPAGDQSRRAMPR